MPVLFPIVHVRHAVMLVVSLRTLDAVMKALPLNFAEFMGRLIPVVVVLMIIFLCVCSA